VQPIEEVEPDEARYLPAGQLIFQQQKKEGRKKGRK
jgi:hypothetical protein